MDPQWKNQNQPSDTSQKSQPSSEPAPPQGPTSPASVPQPVDPTAFAAQNAYDVYDPNAKPPSSGRKIIVPIIVLALLALPAGAYFLTTATNKRQETKASQTPSQQANQTSAASIKVPSEWKPVDNELKLQVKAPDGWKAGPATDSSFGDFTSKTVSITKGDIDFSNPGANSIGLGTQSLKGSSTKDDFEKAITDIDKVSQALAPFGITKDQIKLSKSTVSINGKDWLRVDSEVPGQFSTSIYLWQNDHAIYLSASGKTQADLDKMVNDYLLPMTASIQIQ